MRSKLFFILILVCLWVQSTHAQTQVAKVDSLTMDYYKKCLAKLTDPIALSMADTLFDMAGKTGDTRMQAVALCTKVDHYFYKEGDTGRDSLALWVDEVKAFARKTNQPKYYYFVWTARLISKHIRLGEHNIALVETEKVLKEAEAEGYIEGVADCYSCLANIYIAKGIVSKDLEFTLKEIELSEQYNLERYNISLKYSSAATNYAEQEKKPEKAKPYLEKAIKYANTSYHKLKAHIAYFYYYIAIDDIAKATQELETSRKMVNDDASLERFRDYLYSAEVRYYIVTKEHEKTLQTIDLLEKSYRKSGMLVSVNSTNLMRADTYWEMNDTEKAAAYYRLYLSEQEKEKAKNEEITTAEFATLLNMQKLTVEKAELEKLAQTKHLQNTRIIIVSLSVLLIIIFVFLYKQSILNKKLKRSRDKLNVQNRQLYTAKEELSKAKEMAEESSRLKTLFIQNMSHEIRTPLNSIVGFSDVLSDLFAEDENDDIRQFALLIEQNSQLLLKLIGDILELSNLDDNSEVVEYQLIGVNSCCQESLEKIKPLVNSNTTLNFLPAPDGFVLESNKKMVADVLENLLNNAAKFTQKGNITLACEKDDTKKACVFTVTDTGIGIPLDKQEYVFERFVKLDEFSQGTGLGLSISRLIAEKLGGTLVIDSEYKKGTRFIFTVPLNL